MDVRAAYSFDEASGDVLDRSSNGHNWTLNSGASRTASGHTASGLTKSGAGMAVLSSSPAWAETVARSVMFWQQGMGDAVWWVRYTAAPDTARFGILRLSGTLRARVVTNNGTFNTASDYTPPADGGWHHYAATYDGTTLRLYVDATEVRSVAATGTPLTSDRIDIAEHTLTNFTMDDVRIGGDAATQPDIATLMATPVTDEEAPHAEGTVALSAAAALAVSGRRATAGAARLSATTEATVAGTRSGTGSARLSAAAGVLAAGSSHRSGTVALTASAAVHVAQVGDEEDITLTAALAPQSRIVSTLAVRRWTVTLEAQP